jgi:hypothetical protein
MPHKINIDFFDIKYNYLLFDQYILYLYSLVQIEYKGGTEHEFSYAGNL